MLKRWMMKDLEVSMRVRRGVNLTGARQVGKSTLAEMLNLANTKRFTFDDKLIRLAATEDPNGFVKHTSGQSMVIDEVQKVPDVLDAIKIVLDHDRDCSVFRAACPSLWRGILRRSALGDGRVMQIESDGAVCHVR